MKIGLALTLEEAKIMQDVDVIESVKNGEAVFKIERNTETNNDPLVDLEIAIKKMERLSADTKTPTINPSMINPWKKKS
jgi:hypothetical protein